MDLKRLYTDPKFSGSFSGKQRFLKALKAKDRHIKKSDVEKTLRSIDSYGLHRPLKRPKLFRRIYTKAINYLFQLLLINYFNYY